MTRDRKMLGAAGEDAAARFLKSLGYKVLARNYTSPVGELDLVCHHDDTIVFVEVKTLADDAAGDPEEHVNPAKQRQLARVARAWLAAHRHPDCAYRFDVISVVLRENAQPSIRHFVEAFIPNG
ncbi:MAG: YraN family protein [Planctomycetota bacterium]|nr:MAG: YraN family protein [Planctomycetota bacterium]